MSYIKPPARGRGKNKTKMKTLKLEVGKTYRNRKGEVVKIIENEGIVEYSYEGSNGEWYTESGKWSYYSEEHPKDLIEEVTATRHTRRSAAAMECTQKGWQAVEC